MLGFLMNASLAHDSTAAEDGRPRACSPWPVASMIGAPRRIYQRRPPGRESTPFDWMADTLGLTLAFLLYLWYQRRHGSALDRAARGSDAMARFQAPAAREI